MKSLRTSDTDTRESDACEATELTAAPFEMTYRGPYAMGSRKPLKEGVANGLVKFLRQGDETGSSRSVLGGRAESRGHELVGLGRVFIKQYAHGGLLRRITANRFLGGSTCRSKQEFEMLEYVRSLGIGAPEPLVYITRGSILYTTWLLMEELQDARSLVEVAASAQTEQSTVQLQEIMKALGEQLYVLIKHRVLHIDLHPGNVLVGSDGKIYIVDFDKARICRRSSYELRDIYLRRWRRAVIKHRLSPALTELMSLVLRSYND